MFKDDNIPKEYKTEPDAETLNIKFLNELLRIFFGKDGPGFVYFCGLYYPDERLKFDSEASLENRILSLCKFADVVPSRKNELFRLIRDKVARTPAEFAEACQMVQQATYPKIGSAPNPSSPKTYEKISNYMDSPDDLRSRMLDSKAAQGRQESTQPKVNPVMFNRTMKKTEANLIQLTELVELIKIIDELIIRYIPKCTRYIDKFIEQCAIIQRRIEPDGILIEELHLETHNLVGTVNDLRSETHDLVSTLNKAQNHLPPVGTLPSKLKNRSTKDNLAEKTTLLGKSISAMSAVIRNIQQAFPSESARVMSDSVAQIEQHLHELSACIDELKRNDTLRQAREPTFTAIDETAAMFNENIHELKGSVH